MLNLHFLLYIIKLRKVIAFLNCFVKHPVYLICKHVRYKQLKSS